MGLIGWIVRFGAILAALFAVLVGVLISGLPTQLGLWRYLDHALPQLTGMTPLFHEGTPWQFNYTSLSAQALKGRTFLVTGANAGLGYGTVHYLATHGGRVILGCRSAKNCEEAVRTTKMEAPQAELIPLVLKLDSFTSIKQFSEEVKRHTQELHSLILNAGIGHWPFELTEDGIERQIGVNHFGHAYLVQLLEDLLKKTATKELPATIVVVSSAAHWQTYPEGVKLTLKALNDPAAHDSGMAYGQSKLANILYARAQAERLKPYNILVNSAHPGLVETNIMNHAIDSFQTNYPTVASLLAHTGVAKALGNLFTSLAWNLKDGALTQVYLAVSPEILSKHVTGKYYHPVARETPVDPRYLSNSTMQNQFWALTEQVLKEKAK